MTHFKIPEFRREWAENHLKRFSKELDQVMHFWMTHSHDEKYGGFFSCLGEDGKVYDDGKYGWMQGRQVWTYSRLYNEVPRFRLPELLVAAERGAAFMMSKMVDSVSRKCSFLMTRDGRPVKIQRTLFSEAFYVQALLELGRTKGNDACKREGLEMLDLIIHWSFKDDSALGRPKLSGCSAKSSLATPMVILSLIQQARRTDPEVAGKYEASADKCVKEILQHIQRENSVVLETVSESGTEVPGSEGRLINPGHAIECGWFLLQEASHRNDPKLRDKALRHFIQEPLKRGWDTENGGLFYFLDADGESPVQLEWSMKLWWAHCEALVSLLMAYDVTGDESFAEQFDKMAAFAFEKFSDPKHGDWYGYLDRYNNVNQTFKGGPFKGCFHVPRCLMMCEQLFQKMLQL